MKNGNSKEIKNLERNTTNSNDDIKKLKKINSYNKVGALALVVFVLCISGLLIKIGIDNYNNATLKKTNKTENVILHHRANFHKTDSATPGDHHPVRNTPVRVNEETFTYTYTPSILMFIAIIAFVALSLCGSFAMLSKVLTSENELNSKMFDVHRDIYKEREMWELTQEKKEHELDYKYRELSYKVNEFEKIEKVKKNLYNAKKRAIEAFTEIALKEAEKYEKETCK